MFDAIMLIPNGKGMLSSCAEVSAVDVNTTATLGVDFMLIVEREEGGAKVRAKPLICVNE